jgi:hypothetical protein
MKTVVFVLPSEREAPHARVFHRILKWSKSHDTTEFVPVSTGARMVVEWIPL